MSHLHRFHIEPLSVEKDEVLLENAEAHHALHVVRVRPGDEIALFDGAGNEYDSVVTEATRRDVSVRIDRSRHVPRATRRLTLVQAWLHRDKSVEELICRGTEIGVSAFRFFRARRSERPPKPSDKWQRWAVESCKQCGRLWLPEFHVFPDLESALADIAGTLLIATGDLAPTPLRDALERDDAALIVGPEGDFTSEELELARGLGAKPVSLGDATYRSEVAAVLASSLVLYEMGRLSP